MKSRVCYECKAEMRMQQYTHVENVGGIKVADSSRQALRCTKCDECVLTGTELQGYERRAARVVLQRMSLLDKKCVPGAALKYARKALGYKQQDLAVILGTTMSTVCRWEKDRVKVPRLVALAVVGILYAIETDMDADVGIVAS